MRRIITKTLATALITAVVLCTACLSQDEPVTAKRVEIQEQPYLIETREEIIAEVVEKVVRTTCMLVEPTVINEEEAHWLASLIYQEAGSDWCTDELQIFTGSVVLNRVAHELYPDNIYDVIFQKGQYSCVKSGAIYNEYNDRAYNCAVYLLLNGPQIPSNVVFQAEFTQGDGVYRDFPLTGGRTMYFCYKGEDYGRQETDLR